MYIFDKDGLARDPADGRLVAFHVDSFISSAGAGSQADTIIFRLYHKDQPTLQAHQFVMTAHRAAELGRHLLELAAQIEKEQSAPPEH